MGSAGLEPARAAAPPPPQQRPSGGEDDLSEDYSDATRDEDSFRDPPQEILKTFSTRFQAFDAKSGEDMRSEEARHETVALHTELRGVVDESRSRDNPCHICVFGLMGHGKSRLINLLLASVATPPASAPPLSAPPFSALLDAGGEARGGQARSDGEEEVGGGRTGGGGAEEGWVEELMVQQEVPSGSGATTRSYSRHMLPAFSGGSLARFPFFLVDTIGVKFSDEFDPAPSEVASEMALVRQQLNGLDFRERHGVFRHALSRHGKGVVQAGTDIMDISVEGPSRLPALLSPLLPHLPDFLQASGVAQGLLAKSTSDGILRVTVTLRGGEVVRGVPLNLLDDPDKKNWVASPEGKLIDTRGWYRRVQHVLQASGQKVPAPVWAAWRAEFRNAGFDEVPIVSTHSDVAALFGPKRAGKAALEAQRYLQGIHVNSASWVASKVRFVENYPEASGPQQRRLLSEAGAVEVLVDAAREAQRRERAAESNGGVSSMATSFLVTVGCAAALYKAPGAVRAWAARRASSRAASASTGVPRS
ncbi:hypothetical protein T484DRAFT_1919108 [Baffinella frigidus]|nr:hypothetical protein T484DRAFT_1919108 [Cryptophyta sp. CCMP2293]